MSNFLLFEIKRATMDKIFNFLMDCFSVTSGPMDMIFGLFSKTNVRLLKNIITHFFLKYSKNYRILNIKRSLKLRLAKTRAVLKPSNYMYIIEVYKSFLEWP